MRIASTVVACLFLAAFAVGAYLREHDESGDVASASGAAFGTLLGGLLMGLVARFVYVRWMRREGKVHSHWLLWLAVGFLLIATAGRAAQERDETTGDRLARFQDRQRQECAGHTDFAFPRIEGTTTRPATPEEVGLEDGADAGLQLIAVEEEGEPIAFVTAAIVSPGEAEAFLRGMNGAITRNGGKEQRPADVDGVPVNVFQTPGQAMMTFHRTCHAILVRSRDRESARFVVEPIVTSLR